MTGTAALDNIHTGRRFVSTPFDAVERREDILGAIMLAGAISCCCLPYVVFGPIAAPSQIQPWAALMCWAFVLHKTLTASLRVNRFHLIALSFSLWFMLYIYASGVVGLDYYFRRSASFLICWAILVAAPYISPLMLWRVLKCTLPLWTGFALLGFASNSLYLAITRNLVPTAIGVAGGRGATSLAPEATDFGFTMAFLTLLVLIVRRVLRLQGYVPERWPLWLSLGNVVLSQSGSGFFALAIMWGVRHLTGSEEKRGGRLLRLLVIGGMGLALVLMIGLLPETGVRGVDLLNMAVTSPGSLLNTTLSYRIVHNSVGLLGLFESNLAGYGAGSFANVGMSIYAENDLGRFFGLTGYYAQSVPLSLAGSPLAYFPVIILEYGALGLVYIILLFRTVSLSQMPYMPLALAMIFMTWVQSFPAAYPLFWLLIGLSMNSMFQMPYRLQGIRP